MKARKGKVKGKGRNDKMSRRQRDIESLDMRDDKRVPNPASFEERKSGGGDNDWTWYAANSQLVRDYANFPFGNPVGDRLFSGIAQTDSNSVPGIMAFYYTPTIGLATGETSPINVAMRRLYSSVRGANSGATNYEAPDMMLYILCVDSAYMYHEFMKRVYGVIHDYTAFNRYYPNAILQAMRIDPIDMQKHVNDLRGYINIYAAKLSQLWAPTDLSFFKRHSWMTSGIYTDSNTQKAQTYLYVPENYFKFTIDPTTKVGAASYVSLGTTNSTFQDLVEFGNNLLEPMITNQDFGIMSGDILKRFGEGALVHPATIGEDYQVLPEYNQEVLSQMENATILQWAAPFGPVTQATAVGTGYLKQSSTYNVSYNLGVAISEDEAQDVGDLLTQGTCANKFLNFHHGAVTPEEVMVATRLTCVPKALGVTVNTNYVSVTMDLDNHGSEVISHARIFYFTDATDGSRIVSSFGFGTDTVGVVNANNFQNTIANMGTYLQLLGYLSQFDWHPAVYPHLIGYSSTNHYVGSDVRHVVMDLDYYTQVTGPNLYNMAQAALLSELTIPQIQ